MKKIMTLRQQIAAAKIVMQEWPDSVKAATTSNWNRTTNTAYRTQDTVAPAKEASKK